MKNIKFKNNLRRIISLSFSDGQIWGILKQYTGKIDICGMQFNENDKITVEVDGQDIELSAKEILEKVEEEKQLLESKRGK